MDNVKTITTSGPQSAISTTSDTSHLSVNSSKTPKRKGKSKLLYFWSCEDVCKWLRKHCGQYYQLYSDIFNNQDINGRSLVRLTDMKLQRMGISDEGHREEMLRHIMRLRLKTEGQELKTFDQKKGVGFER